MSRRGQHFPLVALATGAALLPACAADLPVATPAPSPSVTTSEAPSAPPSATPSAAPTIRPTRSASPTPTATSSATPTSTTLPGWLAGGVVGVLPTSRHVVALTFDCGSGAQGVPRIVATLLAQHVPATFFVTGNFARANPGVVAALVHDGFLVGNHTMTHPHVSQLSTYALTSEITGAAASITAVTRAPVKPWFRFPYGEYTSAALRLVHQLGYGAIGWTVDSRGWQGRAAGTVADVVARVRNAVRPGAIVLMHVGANPDDGTTYDADALPLVITALRAAGYGFVTVAG